jgi:uncharacterized protein (DUF433 family)
MAFPFVKLAYQRALLSLLSAGHCFLPEPPIIAPASRHRTGQLPVGALLGSNRREHRKSAALQDQLVLPPLHLTLKWIKMEAMQLFDRITWNPNQMNGQPCIRGMRLTVRRVVEAVAIYPNRDDLFRNYPELEAEDVRQALAFAAACLEDSATESSAA